VSNETAKQNKPQTLTFCRKINKIAKSISYFSCCVRLFPSFKLISPAPCSLPKQVASSAGQNVAWLACPCTP